jgi:hypothetical protein
MALTASEWADNAGDAALGPAWAVEFVLHSWRPGPAPLDPGESGPFRFGTAVRVNLVAKWTTVT